MTDYQPPFDGLFAGNCGHCVDCRWWQTDRNAEAGRDLVGLCLHEELAHFELQVSADSGCNRFKQDRPVLADATGGATGRTA